MQQSTTQQTGTRQSSSQEPAAPGTGTLHEVLIDLSGCNACSGCCDICPDIFEWDEAMGRPSLKRQRATHDEVREAISLCPRRCISAEGWTEEFY